MSQYKVQICNEGLEKAKQLNGKGWSITPSTYQISATAGDFDPSRTKASLKVAFISGAITPVEAANPKDVQLKINIAVGQSSTTNPAGEIAILAKNPIDNSDLLLAICQPVSTVDIIKSTEDFSLDVYLRLLTLEDSAAISFTSSSAKEVAEHDQGKTSHNGRLPHAMCAVDLSDGVVTIKAAYNIASVLKQADGSYRVTYVNKATSDASTVLATPTNLRVDKFPGYCVVRDIPETANGFDIVAWADLGTKVNNSILSPTLSVSATSNSISETQTTTGTITAVANTVSNSPIKSKTVTVLDGDGTVTLNGNSFVYTPKLNNFSRGYKYVETLQVIVEDTAGYKASSTLSITVTTERAPTAIDVSFFPTEVNTGESITLTPLFSVASGGSISKVVWEVLLGSEWVKLTPQKDGTTYNNKAVLETEPYAYYGQCSVKITATDDQGVEVSALCHFGIMKAAPTGIVPKLILSGIESADMEMNLPIPSDPDVEPTPERAGSIDLTFSTNTAGYYLFNLKGVFSIVKPDDVPMPPAGVSNLRLPIPYSIVYTAKNLTTGLDEEKILYAGLWYLNIPISSTDGVTPPSEIDFKANVGISCLADLSTLTSRAKVSIVFEKDTALPAYTYSVLDLSGFIEGPHSSASGNMNG